MAHWIDPGIGRSAIRTPVKPTSTAVQRRQPTCSLSSGIDSTVTIKGALKLMV